MIIGNGASLRDVPLSFLVKYPTFGQNKIFLLEGFTPKYYVAVNPLVIEQSIDQINAMQCSKWIRESHSKYIIDSHPIQKTKSGKFHTTPPAAHEGYTVTFVSMQIAYWLGYRQILLVGIDHRYTYNGKPNKQNQWRGDDVNHFHADYFRGQQWNNPDLARSEIFYKMANLAYRAAGGRIVNLTPNTALDVFEKGELSEWA